MNPVLTNTKDIRDALAECEPVKTGYQVPATFLPPHRRRNRPVVTIMLPGAREPVIAVGKPGVSMTDHLRDVFRRYPQAVALRHSEADQ